MLWAAAGCPRVQHPQEPQERAAHPRLSLLCHSSSEEPSSITVPWVKSCATEQDAFGSTARFFLQKWIDFLTGLAAFLCTWVLASPVEEFVVSKTLITLV